MHFKTLRFEQPESGVGLITLNRPEQLNAINLDMLDDLHNLFYRLSTDDKVRVLVITGEGRGFCSGADLKDPRIRQDAGIMFSSAAAHLVHIQKRYADRIVELRRLPQPVISAVQGPAAGGGFCLALASDVVIATPRATFIASFANIGLSGGELGTSYFLPRAVGKVRASEILLTGRTVGAQEAERIGIVSKLVGESDLMNAVMETAHMMLEKSPLGLRLTKETLNQNLDAPSLEAAVELENRNQSICCFTPEFFKAVERFAGKK